MSEPDQDTGIKFRQALRKVTKHLVDDSTFTDEEIENMMQDVWDTWDEEEAKCMDKMTRRFDHEEGTVWVCIYPIGPNPIWNKLSRDRMPQIWLGDDDDNAN